MGDWIDEVRGMSRAEYFRATRLGSPKASAAEIRELAHEVSHVPQARRSDFARAMWNVMGSPFEGWPICAVCEGPVENVQAEENIQTRELIIIAMCHGDFEEVKLPAVILTQTERLSIGGRVFERARLPAPAAVPQIEEPEWVRKSKTTVAELHARYHRGDRPIEADAPFGDEYAATEEEPADG